MHRRYDYPAYSAARSGRAFTPRRAVVVVFETDSSTLRTVLALDAAATALVGVLVFARPALLADLASDRPRLAVLADETTASRVGLAVAVFGTAKGLLYAALLAAGGEP